MSTFNVWEGNYKGRYKPGARSYGPSEGHENTKTLTYFVLSCFSGKNTRAILLTLILILLYVPAGRAQELNATVQVDKSRLSGTSFSFLDTFDEKIEAYLNEHNWIDPRFGEHEKIDISMRIILLNADNNYNFEASIIINSRRPVYNTLQQTSLLLFNDENWVFNYMPNQALIHDELQFNSVTTLLDFFAYVILGFDFDSFSEFGGNPYLNRAQSLAELAQTSSAEGWRRTGNARRNRVQLITSLMNPNYAGLRRAIYLYHRHGLDRFLDNPEEARRQTLASLDMIEEAAQKTTDNLLFNIFFNTKYREITSIFENAPTDLRLEAYHLLSRTDPTHLSEYDKLR